jgi:PAS domain S-box-containing protein
MILQTCLVAIALACAAATTYMTLRARHAESARRLAKTQEDMQLKELLGLRFAHAAAERRYKMLFADVSDAILITRPSGEVVAANAAIVRMLGYDCEAELRSQNAVSFYVDPAVRDTEMKRLGGEQMSRARELLFVRKNGTYIKVLVSGRILEEEGGAGVLFESILTDITELRRAEQQCSKLEHELRLSQKLQSIGNLSAGIAHEINTPLQYISDSVHILRRMVAETLQIARAEPCSEAQTRLTELESQISRALDRTGRGIASVTRTVRAINEYSHPERDRRSTADLNEALNTTLAICSSEYKHVADIETDFGELPGIWCQLGAMQQVFVNLIVNAAHAIEQADKGRGTIRISSSVEDANVVVSITDTGCGIPDTIRHRIFDPFFTTKPVGKGTGQGLALVRAIIEDEHCGRIQVDGAPGRGATFTLRLPIDMRHEQGMDGEVTRASHG